MTAAFGKFSGKDDDVERPMNRTASTSVIGHGTELVGDLKGSGQLRVEGRVEGTIRLDGEVQIASGGRVEGRIEADAVVAAGHVSGTIAARESVRLEDGCQVEADILSPRLQLEEGGRINGRVDMSADGPDLDDLGGRPAASGPGSAPSPAAGEPSPAGEDDEGPEDAEEDETSDDETETGSGPFGR